MKKYGLTSGSTRRWVSLLGVIVASIPDLRAYLRSYSTTYEDAFDSSVVAKA